MSDFRETEDSDQYDHGAAIYADYQDSIRLRVLRRRDEKSWVELISENAKRWLMYRRYRVGGPPSKTKQDLAQEMRAAFAKNGISSI